MFIAKDNDLIVLAKKDKKEFEQKIQFLVYTSIEETDIEYELYEGVYLTKEEIAQKERERLDMLYMTRSDFFDGMILAFGLNSKELRAVIENILNSLNITDIEVKVALNNYDNALNFYRKHTLFTLLSGIEIPISEEVKIVITSEQWDKFFETKDYTYLLPSDQVSDQVEVTDENTTDTDE